MSLTFSAKPLTKTEPPFHRMTSSAQVLQHNAEQAASTLPPLLINANRVAATVSLGSHGRRRAGPGDTFWQFRQYSQSDPAYMIDWRQSAKFDHVFVREREWDASQTAALWCDCSPSMAFRSSKKVPTKSERASVIGLALASLMISGGERVRLLGFEPSASSGRLALIQMAHNLERAITDQPASTVPVAQASLPRHISVVLISDFLFPIEEAESALSSFTGQASSGHLLQILDPAEESLPYRGRIRFQGMENEGSLLIERTEDVRKDYIGKMAEHRASLAALTDRLGWSFSVHHTDKPPHTALAALHMRMAEER
ncbi:MAG: DUF58 domain-containing protein [Rhodospirillaceae bacterium]|jgi:uncharacterized protein (DUF58 family)|nr:DUF58 domain-containing protein [Rhodospirillaceae bacterium]